MSGRDDYRLTGLEQYSLERAGYFIRRGVVPLDAIGQAATAARRLAEYAKRGDEPPWDLMETASSLAELVQIQAIAGDLLPSPDQSIAVCLPETDRPSEWGRGYPLFVESSEAELAAALHGANSSSTIYAPLGNDAGTLVVPGSHTQPLTPAQISLIGRDPHADLINAIRIRLQPGDVFVYCDGILRRNDPAAGTVTASVIVNVKRGD